jgi:hypothetical protein
LQVNGGFARLNWNAYQEIRTVDSEGEWSGNWLFLPAFQSGLAQVMIWSVSSVG